MTKKNKNKKQINNERLLRIAAAFFILIMILAALVWSYQNVYAQKVYPGVRIGNLELGGKTFSEVYKILEVKVQEIMRSGLKFYYNDQEVVVNPLIVSPTDPDLTYEILTFDLEKSINEALRFGRSKNLLVNLQEQIGALLKGAEITPRFQLNQKELKNILKENFSAVAVPAQDAKLTIEFLEGLSLKAPSGTAAIGGVLISVQNEKLGWVFDYELAIAKTQENLSRLEAVPVKMYSVTDYPQIYKKDTNEAQTIAKELLHLAPLTFTFEDKTWEVSQKKLAEWLEFKLADDLSVQNELDANTNRDKSKVVVSLNKEQVNKYLETLAPEINIEAQDAKFKIVNGKVSEFQASSDGRSLDYPENFAKIEEQIIQARDSKIDFVVKIVKAKVTTENVNDLGINELIGRGQSNFAGSRANRRHNIKVGSESLNGILIKPGEEFSLIKALGEVSAATGYLPEMVIKGNKTTAEYGGGLCQIGTTTFRVALASGLPITERQNHSYRVSFYEPPPGLDATIYDPHPDLRFINDTGHYILLQTEIEGDDLIFDFWGTNDGRKIERTEPKIYNFVKPPPTKIIETEDLPPGEKKCTERAHTGATTDFTYRVTYPDGEVKERVFLSRYKPWQEVCLVGVEPREEEEGENQEGTEAVDTQGSSLE